MKRCLLAVLLLSLLTVTGCRIQVDKSKNGEDKNVKIDTPMGGLHVSTDQITGADVGLPVYPGAQIVADKENDKSADIHMGFGKFQLRVKVVNYSTPDPQDKVLAFYGKALGRYGDVVKCDGNNAVGTPTVTREGLTCGSSGHSANVKIDQDEGLNLRAGSKHHQHIVGFKNGDGNGTKFALIELELPDVDNESAQSQ